MNTSILWPAPQDKVSAMPDYFVDLNLDQLLERMIGAEDRCRLRPLYYTLCGDREAVAYRQAAFRDCMRPEIKAASDQFTEQMSEVRRQLKLARSLSDTWNRRGWFFEAAALYCEAVEGLCGVFQASALDSTALTGLRRWLAAYAQSRRFVCMKSEIAVVREALGKVYLRLNINGTTIRVGKGKAEPEDYGAVVGQCFEKLSESPYDPSEMRFRVSARLNHIERAILGQAVDVYPKAFGALGAFCGAYPDFLEAEVLGFEREYCFLQAYLRYIKPLEDSGLPFCVPEVARGGGLAVRDAFDLVLAKKSGGRGIVVNSCVTRPGERILVVSGPNQGGKTTFARMLGQLCCLAALGLPVPGASAALFLPSRIFTHFERGEDSRGQNGKLQDDLLRVHAILAQADAHSLVLLNEIFTSTALKDGLALGRKVFARLQALGAFCVCVTFMTELSKYSKTTASFVSTLDAGTAERSFKILRRPADGQSYAQALVRKYCLREADIKRRVSS